MSLAHQYITSKSRYMYNGINNSSNTISGVLQLILGTFRGNHTQIVLGVRRGGNVVDSNPTLSRRTVVTRWGDRGAVRVRCLVRGVDAVRRGAVPSGRLDQACGPGLDRLLGRGASTDSPVGADDVSGHSL